MACPIISDFVILIQQGSSNSNCSQHDHSRCTETIFPCAILIPFNISLLFSFFFAFFSSSFLVCLRTHATDRLCSISIPPPNQVTNEVNSHCKRLYSLYMFTIFGWVFCSCAHFCYVLLPLSLLHSQFSEIFLFGC